MLIIAYFTLDKYQHRKGRGIGLCRISSYCHLQADESPGMGERVDFNSDSFAFK